MNNYFKFICWAIISILLCSLFCGMLTAASTINNILALIFIAIWIYVSFKSICFTNITFKKNEKNN